MTRFTGIPGMIFISLLMLAPLPGHTESGRVTSHQLLSSDKFERRIQLNIEGDDLGLLLNRSYVTSNAAVLDHFGSALDNDALHFTGQIEGDRESWVRVSLYESQLSGVISRSGRRYKLSTTKAGTININPLADTHGRADKITKSHSYLQRGRSIAASRSLGTSGADITHIANIAIVVDSQYNDAHNGLGLEKALSIINAVDGIYREEFGLALKVISAINVVDRNSDPFDYGVVPIETMLRNFRDYRMQSAELADASMVHLFTGNTNLDEPVGLAWINTTCRPDGYDVGISRPYRHDILLAAHEMAHNLGAQHDNETVCSAQTDKVMWPIISSQTSQQFSSCTHTAVKRALQSSCHARAIDLDLQLSLSSHSENTISATVRNNDLQHTNTSATLTFDVPMGDTAVAYPGECGSPAQQPECSIGALLPVTR